MWTRWGLYSLPGRPRWALELAFCKSGAQGEWVMMSLKMAMYRPPLLNSRALSAVPKSVIDSFDFLPPVMFPKLV